MVLFGVVWFGETFLSSASPFEGELSTDVDKDVNRVKLLIGIEQIMQDVHQDFPQIKNNFLCNHPEMMDKVCVCEDNYVCHKRFGSCMSS